MPDFPTGLPDIPAADGAAPLATMHTSVSHSSGMNRAIANILALATKLGIGSSPPTANTVLRGTGSGTSAFGQVVNADVASGALISVAKLEHVGANNVLKSNGTANIGGQIGNAEVGSAAGIAVSKLGAGGTANRVVGTADGGSMGMTQINGSMIGAEAIGNSHISGTDRIHGDNKLINSSVTGNSAGSAIGAGAIDANRIQAASFNLTQVNSAFADASIPNSKLVTPPLLIGFYSPGSYVASITFSPIPGTYRHLWLVASLRVDAGGVGIGGAALRFNGDTGANYAYQYAVVTGGAVSAGGTTVQGTETWAGGCALGGSPAGNFALNDLLIGNYTDGSRLKTVRGVVSGLEGSLGSAKVFFAGGVWNNSGAAITSLTILPPSGNFVPGCMVSLYGLSA